MFLYKILFYITICCLILSCKQDCPPIPISTDPPIPTPPTYQTKLFNQSLDTLNSTCTITSSLLPLEIVASQQQTFTISRWTRGGAGVPGFGNRRMFFNIDLTHIPTDAIIDSAFINLYAVDNTSAPGTVFGSAPDINSYSSCGENSFFIKKNTSSWERSTTNWNTMPSYTDENMISIADHGTGFPSLNNLDITTFVKDWVAHPEQNFGVVFMLQNETGSSYRRILFGANGIPTASLRPLVKVYYQVLE